MIHYLSVSFLDWNVDDKIPGQIYLSYVIQLSWYIYGIYATLYVDVWRKDSHLMMLHHVVTLLLVGFSFAFRCACAGAVR